MRMNSSDLRLVLNTECNYGSYQYRLVDLAHVGGSPADFPLSSSIVGSYESSLYDAGQGVSWDRIAWDETLPTNTDVKFQLAFSNSPSGPWSYIGPNGTAGTYFTTPAGESLPNTSAFEGQYARFRATLSSSDGLSTPSFGNVHLSFSGSGMLASSVRNFAYDQAGNITSIETVDDAGSSLDNRNPVANPINAKNQVIQQDVGGDSWVYSWDNNGNLIGKTNGTDSWTYSWTGDENRLVRVQGPGGVDVHYSYDQMGRMLTRNDGVQLTQLTWDGFDCVREQRGSDDFIYHIPDGMLQSFSLNGKVYTVHSDALASVRMITNNVGAVVARMEYGAYGAEVFVSAIPELDNLPFRFVGSLGVRFDSATGLHYMRARWYDSSTQRFISRDPIGLQGGANLYSYCNNRPLNNVDPDGLYADVTRNGKKVKIKMTVFFCSDNPRFPKQDRDKAIDDFRRKMSEVWGGSHDDFEVTLELDAKWIGKCPLDCDMNPKVNYITLMEGTGTSTTGFGGNKGTWYAGQPPETFAHEAGHLMGLQDGYRERNRIVNGREVRELDGLMQDTRGRTDPRYRDRYQNNIMGDRAPRASGLDIQDIVDYSTRRYVPRLE